ncbi:hypothetical protein AB0I16_33225 [Streptomyces sp. NPDC050703]|uniref:hypothetical protein n=1 Tax=Streptomyces sp. NPDC050703 TaxID=3157218 RepID=UPI00341EA771
MGTNGNIRPPSLIAELDEMKRRLSAVERKPDVLAKFDRYPTTEWAAVGRDRIVDNPWSSCGIANVTGLVYDRVEARFITNRIVTGKREAEIRLAAFKHDGIGKAECVSASNVWRLHGTPTGAINTFVFRWVHGIPFGWDYEDDAAVYTIELQHRYLVGPDESAPLYLAAPLKYGATDDTGLNGFSSTIDGAKWWQLFFKDGSGWAWGRHRIGSDSGSYAISNFHYCVGLSEERLPEATPAGGGWSSMTNVTDGGPSAITDPWVG